MTNAEKHVAALIAQFGEPPFELQNFGCTVLALWSVGNIVHASVEVEPGNVVDWVVPDPDVMIPDPDGEIEKLILNLDDDGNPVETVVRFSENPVAVASAELSSFLKVAR
jgi:hypothetical protein